MIVSVVIVSYCRSWALKHCLESLRHQKRPPDEVVLVLKSCGDESESIIEQYRKVLPVKLILQNARGSFIDAYELGYRNASGDLILFIDDDAIADEEWVLRYEKFFKEYQDAGAAVGIVLKAYLDEQSGTVKTEEPFRINKPTVQGLHRKPLKELENYCTWISTAGFTGGRTCNGIYPDMRLSGCNMGFRAHLIKDLPLSKLFNRSRKGFLSEQLMAYHIVKKGYKTYAVRDISVAPIVWHIAHQKSLTRGQGFWHEFWIHYDRVAMFWRLKKLGARLSYPRYLLGLAILLRRKTIPRLLATLYGLVVK